MSSDSDGRLPVRCAGFCRVATPVTSRFESEGDEGDFQCRLHVIAFVQSVEHGERVDGGAARENNDDWHGCASRLSFSLLPLRHGCDLMDGSGKLFGIGDFCLDLLGRFVSFTDEFLDEIRHVLNTNDPEPPRCVVKQPRFFMICFRNIAIYWCCPSSSCVQQASRRTFARYSPTRKRAICWAWVHQEPTFWGGALLLTAEFVSAPWPVARGTLEGPFSACSPAARRRTMKAAQRFLNYCKLDLALLRTGIAKAMPLPVGLVVVGLRRRPGRIVRRRWRRGVLLWPIRRRRRRIAVLLLWRIALALIGLRAILWTILRPVLLLLLRRRSVLILLRRRIRIGIGVVGTRIITAVIWISISVRIAVIAAVVGIAESKSESDAAPAVASAVTVAAISIAAAISVATVAATISTYRATSIATTTDSAAAETTPTPTYSVAAATTAVSTTAPLGKTGADGENQRYQCNLQRAHKKLLGRPSNYRTRDAPVGIPNFYRGTISFSTYLPIRSTSTLSGVNEYAWPQLPPA